MKSIKMVLFSFLIGGILAIGFFFSVKETPSALEKNMVYAYQVGVYASLDNAVNAMARYPVVHKYQDNGLYRLFIGVTSNNEELLSNYFANYEIYKKPLVVSDQVYQDIQKYDELLKNSSKENYGAILNKMLEVLDSEFQN